MEIGSHIARSSHILNIATLVDEFWLVVHTRYPFSNS
jgi:hypothetical protein